MLAEAKEMAAHSPWLGEIVANLEKLAAKWNDVLFSKGGSVRPERHKFQAALRNHVKDFHVMTGPFETDVCEVDAEIAGHGFTANCGVLQA